MNLSNARSSTPSRGTDSRRHFARWMTRLALAIAATLSVAGLAIETATPALGQPVPLGPPKATEDEVAERPLGREFELVNVRLEVIDDASLAVEERTRVRFRGPYVGLERRLPLQHASVGGTSYAFDYSDLEVSDGGGSPLGYRVLERGGQARVRIVVPDAEDFEGEIVLRYRVHDAVRRRDERDHVEWPLLGHGWSSPVRRLEAVLVLPAKIGERHYDASAWRGGEPRPDAGLATSREATTVTLTPVTDLAPHERVTLLASFPSGTVIFPTAADRLRRRLGPHLPALLPLGLLFALFATWWLRGRGELDSAAIVPGSDPPDGLDPVELGILTAGRVRASDLAGGIAAAVSRGAVEVSNDERGRVRLGSPPGDRPESSRAPTASGSPTDASVTLVRSLLGDGAPVRVDHAAPSDANHLASLDDVALRGLIARGFVRRAPREIRDRFAYGIALTGIALGSIGLTLAWTAPFFVATALFVWGAAMLAKRQPFRTADGDAALARVLGLELPAPSASDDEAARALPWFLSRGDAGAWLRRFGERPAVLAPGMDSGEFVQAIRSASEALDDGARGTGSGGRR